MKEVFSWEMIAALVAFRVLVAAGMQAARLVRWQGIKKDCLE